MTTKTDAPRTAYIALKAQSLPDGTFADIGEEIPPEIAEAPEAEPWLTWGYIGKKTVPASTKLPQPKVRSKPPVAVTVAVQVNPTKVTHCPTHPHVPSTVHAAEPGDRTTRLYDGREVPVSGFRLWTYCGAAECQWWAFEDFKDDREAWESARSRA